MLRSFYRWLLRLHPPRFRDRFAEEMMSIFDHFEEREAGAKLVGDAFVSLVRQWSMRSESWAVEARALAPAGTDAAPSFFTFKRFRPRKNALLAGVVLTCTVYSVLFFAIRHSKAHSMYLPHVIFESDAGADLKPLTRAPQRARAVTAPPQTPAPAWPRTNPSGTERPLPGDVASKERIYSPRASTRTGTGKSDSSTNQPQALPGPLPIQSSRQTFAHIGASRETLLSYVGTYTMDPPGSLVVLITVEGADLTIEFPGEPKRVLVQEDERRFAFSDAANCWLEFIKVDNGAGYDVHISRNGQESRGRRKTN